MENKKERLFSEFAPVSRQEWLDKITVDLKGADFNKKLVWRTNEGFSVQPFYLREDVENFPTTTALPGRYPFVRGNKVNDNNWYVRQNVKCGDAKETNKKVLDLLGRGVIVKSGATVSNAVVMQGCVIESGARVENAIVDRDNVVPERTELRGTSDDLLVKGKMEE